MDKTLVIFGALLVISLLLGAGMVVTSASNAGFTKESAIKSASDFLNGEATYKFDGMQGTMTANAQKVGDVYVVTADFTSRQAGYGDRAGMMMAQVLTTHTCVIKVDQNGKIISAIMDGQWDMVKQQLVPGLAVLPSPPAFPQ